MKVCVRRDVHTDVTPTDMFRELWIDRGATLPPEVDLLL